MPSEPVPLSKLVRVSHPVFGEKLVRRDQLGALSGRWKRAIPRIRPAPKAAGSDTTDTGTTAPDKSKED